MGYSPRGGLVLRVLAAAVLAACFSGTAAAQGAAPGPAAAPPAAPAAERYLLHVEFPEVPIHEKPDANATVVGRLEQGVEIEADRKTGDWYRIRRVSGEEGWVLNATVATGRVMTVRPFPADQRIAYDAAATDPRVPQSLTPAEREEREKAAQGQEPGVDRRRPQGTTVEPRLPIIDPSRVAPPSPLYLSDEIPIRDRWRLMQSLNLLPYNKLDPYNPNVLKGDLPVLQKELGNDWFFNLSAVSDTLIEGRRLPIPVGAQSTRNPGSNNTFGNGRQTTLAETGIFSFALIKGNTTFRPPDYEFRFVPVVNINRTITEELRAVSINPAAGLTRDDNFLGVQELFVDKHLRDVSERYDFDSIRVGIQPITADFRGFLFLDQPFGVRLFGIRDNNQWQYNLAWFRRLEKDTNSGLNDIMRRMRADDVYLFNVYRQDSLADFFGQDGADSKRFGFTSQVTVLHNRNREGSRPDFYNENGFLERPAIFGSGRRRNYDVTYLGYNGDGHIGPWNISASAYLAIGTDDRGQISGLRESIDGTFGAIELSRDFDWVRLRFSGLYQSGDKNPFDGKAQGYDAVLENPQFAGADTSYWIRQAVPLVGGGGVALSIRNGVLASLRTSREFGQSNFTNPGLHLFGVGADFDVSPQLRVISNVNYLEFDNLSSLAVLRNQRFSSTRIGTDVSIGVQYRPFFTQNVVLNASIAALYPSSGLKELYGNAVDSTQYSGLINLLLTF